MQRAFAAKEAQLVDLASALATEQQLRLAEVQTVTWLRSKVNVLSQENYAVSYLKEINS